jgi:hypothetical protein
MAFPAAEIGEAERARKDNSSWAVIRLVEVHLTLASSRLDNMPGRILLMPRWMME